MTFQVNFDPEAPLERLGGGGGTADGDLKQLKLLHAPLVRELPCIMLKPGKFGNKNTAVQLNKLLRHRNVTKLGSHLNSLLVQTGQRCCNDKQSLQNPVIYFL